jgi:hypothetical protein
MEYGTTLYRDEQLLIADTDDDLTTVLSGIVACTVVAMQWTNQQTRSRGKEHACNNRRVVFSVRSAPRLYNKNPRPADLILEKRWQ